jgi:hypothetical protein
MLGAEKTVRIGDDMMKAEMDRRHDRVDDVAEAARALQRIPNVGPAIAEDLIRLGIRSVDDLTGRNPAELYGELCRMDGVRHDPCVLDVFSAAVSYVNGEPPEPWWEFSRRRKKRQRTANRRDTGA